MGCSTTREKIEARMLVLKLRRVAIKKERQQRCEELSKLTGEVVTRMDIPDYEVNPIVFGKKEEEEKKQKEDEERQQEEDDEVDKRRGIMLKRAKTFSMQNLHERALRFQQTSLEEIEEDDYSDRDNPRRRKSMKKRNDYNNTNSRRKSSIRKAKSNRNLLKINNIEIDDFDYRDSEPDYRHNNTRGHRSSIKRRSNDDSYHHSDYDSFDNDRHYHNKDVSYDNDQYRNNRRRY